jgi:molybdopterin-dependent oxidoreductase alpha subunit
MIDPAKNIDKPNKVSAEPPQRFTGLKLTKPKKTAAGIPALLSVVNQLSNETGLARGFATLAKMNQKEGFDCPGCAWPDPDEKRSFLGEYCENGAKAIAEEATRKRADPHFFANHTVTELSQLSDYELGRSGRITHPMQYDAATDTYKPLHWDEAFELIAEELNSLNNPDEAVFYTSGRASNEAAFLYQLFVRQFGTNNLPDCSNMCHESSGSALSATVGIGKGSVTLDDFNHAEVIIVIGQNPGTNHPRMLTALEQAKQRGAKIISVNPLIEAGLINFKNPQHISMLTGGTDLTDLFLQVRINGDLPLLKALILLLLQKETERPGYVLDLNFINNCTKGFDEFKEEFLKEDLDALIEACGVSRDRIEEAAEMLASNKNIIICWAMGLTQHKNAVGTIREIVNLLLMKGSIARQGAGTCPVRGHSNVQGDRTMGIWEKPKEEFLQRLDAVFSFEAPRAHGYDVVQAIHAMHKGRAKVFFALGGNFLSATPDTLYTAEALQKCSLTVHVSTKPNRSHLVHGKKALILPCLGRSEQDLQQSGPQFVSVENSMGVVSKSEGDVKPASAELLSEVAIVCRLAVATLGGKSSVDWKAFEQNYDLIRDAIEKVVPGFEDYNRKVRSPGGFYLPNGSRSGEFTTPDGKAHFSNNPYEPLEIGEHRFVMMTIRTHDQFNTTIYGLDDRYRGILNERRVVLMNREDMLQLGLKQKQVVHLKSYFRGEERVASRFMVVPYDIPRGCTATYFPEANVLVPIDSTADISNTPTSKSVIISVHAAEE